MISIDLRLLNKTKYNYSDPFGSQVSEIIWFQKIAASIFPNF